MVFDQIFFQVELWRKEKFNFSLPSNLYNVTLFVLTTNVEISYWSIFPEAHKILKWRKDFPETLQGGREQFSRKLEIFGRPGGVHAPPNPPILTELITIIVHEKIFWAQ